jgi:hypothetical protein
MADITVVDELQKADQLRQRGVISQQAFDSLKARLLTSSAPAGLFVAGGTPPPAAAPVSPLPPPRPAGAPPETPPPKPPPSPPTAAPLSRSTTGPRFWRWPIAGIGVAVIALVVTFVTVVGHGGGRLNLTGTPSQIALASLSRTQAANTVQMKATFSVTGTPSVAGHSGKPVSVSMSEEGAFDFTHKLLTLTGRIPGAPAPTQVRVIGPTMYISSPGLQRADGGRPWVRVDLAQFDQKEGQGDPFSVFSELPQLLGQLQQHSSQIKEVGQATIEGVATIHYRMMLTGTADSSSSGAPVTSTASLPVDVWVNGQRRLSQLRMQIPFFGMEMSETLTLDAYGSPVSVTPPPADQTANGTPLLNSGQLTQILNGASTTGTTSPTTTAPVAMNGVTITECQVDSNDSTVADISGSLVNNDTQTDDYLVTITLLEGSVPVGWATYNENAVPPGQTLYWSTNGRITGGSGSNLTCQLAEVNRTPSS